MNQIQKKNLSVTRKILLGFSIVIFSISCDSVQPAKNIKMIPLFTENMVLQQKQDIIIWGKADPNGEVTVGLNNQERKTQVDTDGNWKVTLNPISAGGPYELNISGEEKHIIKNVLVGEVWVCSGQSNMEMTVHQSLDADNEIGNANYQNIRFIQVDKKIAEIPQENFDSEGWNVCSSETIPNFSAVAYYFGRKLNIELNVPIGLIQTAWGGTVVEAWTSGKTLKKIPEFKDAIESLTLDKSTDQEKIAAIKKKLEAWPNSIEQVLKEKGTFNHGFEKENFNTKKWKTMKLPATWESTGMDYDGVVWFSKEIDVPDSWQGNDLLLSLGKINDYDITWFNGKRVGRTTDVSEYRDYVVPSANVNKGKNKIVVQVLDIGNSGGIYGPSKRMLLKSKTKEISLVGDWKFKKDPIHINVDKLPIKPTKNVGANKASVLYNGMINPLIPYGIKGAIWYQGESNADRAYQYRTLFKTLIKDWRTDWKQGEFPFYFVQLANFKESKSQPANDSWAELREAQTMALELPNTGMAVAIDIGNPKDIHPKNKQDVGKRLALNALAGTYGKTIPYSGPMYQSMEVDGSEIRVQFDYVYGGLKVQGGEKLVGFEIAGEDKKFVWANATIKGDTIEVWSSAIKNPVAVRYAWSSNPVCNLYNEAGLPASPFRTDIWEGKTFGKK